MIFKANSTFDDFTAGRGESTGRAGRGHGYGPGYGPDCGSRVCGVRGIRGRGEGAGHGSWEDCGRCGEQAVLEVG